jgi:hypothetical protein
VRVIRQGQLETYYIKDTESPQKPLKSNLTPTVTIISFPYPIPSQSQNFQQELHQNAANNPSKDLYEKFNNVNTWICDSLLPHDEALFSTLEANASADLDKITWLPTKESFSTSSQK